MKKYYFTITLLLALLIGITSCSNEETKTQNQIAVRPSVPIQNREVQIGTQIWMTKNLNVSRYRNGDPIPQVTDPTQWENLMTGAWCYYNNDPINGPIYGKLYNWYAVNDPRGLSPAGWHVSSDNEWTQLADYLGGTSIAGGKMKATGTISAGTGLWLGPNNAATNESGFTGLPGGVKEGSSFTVLGTFGVWWTSSAFDTSNATSRSLSRLNGGVFRAIEYKFDGRSVRCVRN